LLGRRSATEPTEIAYYLSNGSEQMPLRRLAEVASARYSVEQCIEKVKGQTGLDHYQVRHWHSWHRHIRLSMMANAFLMSLRLRSIQLSETAADVASADVTSTDVAAQKRDSRDRYFVHEVGEEGRLVALTG
jgi:hypothetical protein